MLTTLRAARTAASCTRQFSSNRVLHAITNFTFPAMSPTMTEGGIASWKVKEGDSFSPGDVLLEIETDKATMDVEAQDEGIMAKIIVGDGSKAIPVGKVVALLAEEGDDISNVEAPEENASAETASKSASKSESKENSSAQTSETNETSSKSSASQSNSSSNSSSTSSDSSPSSTASESQLHAHPTHSKPLLPSVLRQLVLGGVKDPSVIKATGHQGMLTKGDVLAYLGKIKNARGSSGVAADKAKEAMKKSSEKSSTATKEAPKTPIDGPTLRQLIAMGLNSGLEPKIVPSAAPVSIVAGFDEILDQYLPPAQRSTSQNLESPAAARMITPEVKKDPFDAFLEL